MARVALATRVAGHHVRRTLHSLLAKRLLPALCGSAMVPLAILSCSRMGMHPLAAAFAGWLLLLDPLWLCVSRLHLNDMVM